MTDLNRFNPNCRVTIKSAQNSFSKTPCKDSFHLDSYGTGSPAVQKDLTTLDLKPRLTAWEPLSHLVLGGEKPFVEPDKVDNVEQSNTNKKFPGLTQRDMQTQPKKFVCFKF